MLKQRWPNVPLLGLTATATNKVKEDVVKRLNMQNPVILQSSFNRPNLQYEIRHKKKLKNVDGDISNLLKTRFKNKCGIIYCISRKDCEKLAETLKRNYNIKCDYYHAEMTYKKRQEVQSNWMQGEILVIVATIAFGMGINKRDVRFVIHYAIPKSLEGYVQECGRSGRDSLQAECILYYSYNDRKRNDFFICNNTDNTKVRKNENLHALYSILAYCEEPYQCRRKIQLNFLGEEFDSRKCNKMCDNCKQSKKVIEKNVRKEATVIMDLILECEELSINITMRQLIDHLRGKQVKSYSVDQNKISSSKGVLKHLQETDISRIIIQMLRSRVLKESFSATKVPGQAISNISVYLQSGKHHTKFQNNQLQVTITDGVDKGDALEFNHEEAQDPIHNEVI